MRLRVHVDEDVCIGAGQCEALAPQTFEVGADGVSHVIGQDADPEEALLEAERACPSGAISVRRGGGEGER